MSLLSPLPRWVVDGVRRIGAQVVVSLAATICVALITQSFMDKAPASAPAAAEHPVSDLAVLNLLKAGFEPGGARARVLYPSEFEQLAPPSLSIALPATPAIVLRESTPAPVKVARKATPVAQACGSECQLAAAASVLPPARLTPSPDEAPIRTAEAKKSERARLLGVPLPGFVPFIGETIVKSGALVVNSAVGLGTTLVDMTTSILP